MQFERCDLSCVKTGAKLYIRNYGISVVADVYQVGNTLVFRYFNNQIEYLETDDAVATHVIEFVSDSTWWFHRSDLGITVVPESLVSTYL